MSFTKYTITPVNRTLHSKLEESPVAEPRTNVGPTNGYSSTVNRCQGCFQSLDQVYRMAHSALYSSFAHSSTYVREDLHWLPIAAHIQYKILFLSLQGAAKQCPEILLSRYLHPHLVLCALQIRFISLFLGLGLLWSNTGRLLWWVPPFSITFPSLKSKLMTGFLVGLSHFKGFYFLWGFRAYIFRCDTIPFKCVKTALTKILNHVIFGY